MFHIESMRRNALLITLGTAALLAAPAQAQVHLSEKRQNFISFTPGEAGVSLGAWIAPTSLANGRLHGGLMDGKGNYLLELDGVLVENLYIVESDPSGTAYGVIYANAGFMRAPVAYFLGLWTESQPGYGEFMATLYRPISKVGEGNLLAGVMAGNFFLEGGPANDFEGVDGVDGIGLDEVDDLPHDIGIDDNKWAGGPPIDVSKLMFASLVKMQKGLDALGVAELDKDAWIGGPPIKVITDLQASKIRKFVDLQSAGFYQDDQTPGGLDSIVPHKKGGHDSTGTGGVDGTPPTKKEEPRVGTYRLRWKLFE